jgi:hypothetical protein
MTRIAKRVMPGSDTIGRFEIASSVELARLKLVSLRSIRTIRKAMNCRRGLHVVPKKEKTASFGDGLLHLVLRVD